MIIVSSDPFDTLQNDFDYQAVSYDVHAYEQILMHLIRKDLVPLFLSYTSTFRQITAEWQIQTFQQSTLAGEYLEAVFDPVLSDHLAQYDEQLTQELQGDEAAYFCELKYLLQNKRSLVIRNLKNLLSESPVPFKE